MNTTYFSNSKNQACEKFRPVQELNLWTLQNRCSALPSELKNPRLLPIPLSLFSMFFIFILPILIIIMIISFISINIILGH